MIVTSKRNKERHKTITSDQSSGNAQSPFYSKYLVFLFENQTKKKNNLFTNFIKSSAYHSEKALLVV